MPFLCIILLIYFYFFEGWLDSGSPTRALHPRIQRNVLFLVGPGYILRREDLHMFGKWLSDISKIFSIRFNICLKILAATGFRPFSSLIAYDGIPCGKLRNEKQKSSVLFLLNLDNSYSMLVPHTPYMKILMIQINCSKPPRILVSSLIFLWEFLPHPDLLCMRTIWPLDRKMLTIWIARLDIALNYIN